jgi:hypothetical protein
MDRAVLIKNARTCKKKKSKDGGCAAHYKGKAQQV